MMTGISDSSRTRTPSKALGPRFAQTTITDALTSKVSSHDSVFS